MKDILIRRAFNLNNQLLIECKRFKSILRLQRCSFNFDLKNDNNIRNKSTQSLIIKNKNIQFNLFTKNILKQDWTISKKFIYSKVKPLKENKSSIKEHDELESNGKTDAAPFILKSSETVKQNEVINLEKSKEDLKRQEIGFETESILDSNWKEIRTEYGELLFNYSKLSKKNLTALVVTTTIMGCIMSPMPFDPYIFTLITLGTTLTSSSANTINQFIEVPYDSQMNRTKDRVLVRGNLTPLHAFTFATITGLAGVSILFFCVNPLTAFLGASTHFLYTVIYTPLKRLSPLNTWVGSIVGAIPPLMGYTAMTGEIAPAGVLLAAILYSWQFPHFHALSWNLRSEYSRAGYRMIAVINPDICTSSALTHTIALTVMCSLLAPYLELTTWNFAIDSLPFSLYFVYLAVKFKLNADANSSRKLFRYSLFYLPFVIILMLVTKYPIDDAARTNTDSKILNDNVNEIKV